MWEGDGWWEKRNASGCGAVGQLDGGPWLVVGGIEGPVEG